MLDPLVNEKHGLILQLLSVLDFHEEMRQYSSQEAVANEGLSSSNLETLVDLVLYHVQKNPEILTNAYPEKFKRFDVIKLPNLLSNFKNRQDANDCTSMTKLRCKYFDGIADVLLRSNSELLEQSSDRVDAWTLSNHLVNSLDHDFTAIEKMAAIAKIA